MCHLHLQTTFSQISLLPCDAMLCHRHMSVSLSCAGIVSEQLNIGSQKTMPHNRPGTLLFL